MEGDSKPVLARSDGETILTGSSGKDGLQLSSETSLCKGGIGKSAGAKTNNNNNNNTHRKKYYLPNVTYRDLLCATFVCASSSHKASVGKWLTEPKIVLV